LLVEIRAEFKASKNTYGRDRMKLALRDKGILCGRNRVVRLMKKDGLKPRQVKKFKATTNSNHSLPVSENLLNRDFTADRPNSKWVADITYVRTREGWLYLAVVIDLYSRFVVGWAMSERMTRGLAMDALKMAIWRRKPGRGLLHHSDRGVQYASHDYQALLKQHGIICSMSRKGNCWDNAVAESFFHTLKTELVYHGNYETRREAKQEIFEYMEVFYNRRRLHSALGYKNPSDFERIANVA
jgi:transposase InsO family protein